MAPSQPASLQRLAVDPHLRLPGWNANFMLHTIAGGPPTTAPSPQLKQQQLSKTPKLQKSEQAADEQDSPTPRTIAFDASAQKAATPGKRGGLPESATPACTPRSPDSVSGRQTAERNPKTPMSFRRARSGQSWRQHVDFSAPLSSAALHRLPNALDAEFWLRGAEAKLEAGDTEAAGALLRKGIKRGAQPATVLQSALERLGVEEPTTDSQKLLHHEVVQSHADPECSDVLASEVCARELSFGPSLIPRYTTSTTPRDSTATTTPSRRARQIGSPQRVKTPGSKMYRELKALQGAGFAPALQATGEALGRLELLTPVRVTNNDQAEELGSAIVLTQVRRSARKPGAQEEQLNDLLVKCNYSYAPHDGLASQQDEKKASTSKWKGGSMEGRNSPVRRDLAEPAVGKAESQSSRRYATRSASKQRRQAVEMTSTPISSANLIHRFEAHDTNVVTPTPETTLTAGKPVSGMRRSARFHSSANKSDQ